jgi:hypothetical protein
MRPLAPESQPEHCEPLQTLGFWFMVAIGFGRVLALQCHYRTSQGFPSGNALTLKE